MISQPVRKQTATCPYDFTWARRIRHAFRLLVILVFVFTFALWFSESYLTYDRSETQYRMSLTLYPAQARPILRTVVRRETEQNDIVSSRYLEALAQVEEKDKVLANYDLAYKANPRNAELVMNYGSVLYQDGQYEEARERFREAGVNPPRNILPRYLEAAALAAGMDAEDDVSDVIALLTRANASEDPVLFPEPLWHESLPTQGQRYLEQRCDIARRLMAPLMGCTVTLCARARESIEKGEPRDWDNWLAAIAVMGERLMGNGQQDSPATVPQIIASLQIQEETTKVRAAISKLYGGVVSPELNDKLLRMQGALAGLHEFEANYQQLVNAQVYRLFLPLALLLETAFAFLVLYAVGWFLHYLGAGGKSARAVPHIWIGKVVPVAGLALMLTAMLALMIAHNTTTHTNWEEIIPLAWRLVLGIMLVVGLAYPPLLARSSRMYERISAGISHEANDTAQPDRKNPFTLRHYLGIYGCLLRRYAGILCGGLVITLCLWLLIYHVAFEVYPFQLQLISSSVNMETDVLIEEIRQYLAAP